ncbi:MAG: glycine--tRNA ligase subunit beta, partial [Burkholderiales bacterium]
MELLTEELPPRALPVLGKFFSDEIANGLIRFQLKDRVPDWRGFATPRRLAVLVPDVLEVGQDRATEITGPSTKAPAEAVAGFARKQGVEVSALEQRDSPKGKVYVAHVKLKGASLDAVLAAVVSEAIKKLPIPKIMRWGAGEAQFVRPVHGLLMLHGKRLIAGAVLDLASGRSTRGHRFLGKGEIAVASAEEYESKLRDEGMVIADFGKRKAEIERQLQAEAKRQGGSLGEYQGLLDEVTALVELPTVYAGAFEAAFLEVPQECLILTMRQNQKYFPL